MHYLEKILESDAKQAAFLKCLVSDFSLDDDVFYHLESNLSTVTQDNMALNKAHVIPVGAFWLQALMFSQHALCKCFEEGSS